MRGLDPRIHQSSRKSISQKRWIAGSSPAMTSLFLCHHPRKRMIQYAAALVFNSSVTAYWMPAFAGMTTVAWA
jgi:hypothetical protein